MVSITKILLGCFILIMVFSSFSIIMVKPIFAQTATPTYPSVPIPAPSIPQFTIQFVNASYTVPTSYSIDPYTGQNVTHPEYYVENSSMVLTITNQPFTSFIDNINGAPWNISLFLNIEMKGHFSENWTTPYSADLGYLTQSNSEFTILTFPVVQSGSSQSVYDIESYYSLGGSYNPTLEGIASGGKVDFQVQALIGYLHRVPNGSGNPFFNMLWVFDGQTSAWSNTQTITIPGTTTSSPTPTIPEYPALATFLMFTITAAAGLLVYFKKHKPKNTLSLFLKES